MCLVSYKELLSNPFCFFRDNDERMRAHFEVSINSCICSCILVFRASLFICLTLVRESNT
jgi:hypothetical protein